MNKEEVFELVRRYNEGKCTEQEQSLLETWYVNQSSAPAGEITEFKLEQDLHDIFCALPKSGRKMKLWYKIAATAAVLLMIGAGYFYMWRQATENKDQIYVRNDIKPGGNRAVITLGNGKTIDLNKTGTGILSQEAGLLITKAADGQVICKLDPHAAKESSLMTITTPRGGAYMLELPDGTKVWLNAASSLQYLPVRAKAAERRVTLQGEAYFEVAKDKTKPFFVETAHQVIKVLGTHFNVSAYEDDPSTRTTLFEGSVWVHESRHGVKFAGNQAVLVPGQQSLWTSNGLKVQLADLKEALAWKNGYFIFNEETLGSIMQKVSRWYNIDVVFKDDLEKTSFIGVISRSKNLASVLQLLQETGNVHFKMEGRSVIVMK
ncbi:FecR family protein [Pedobacter sp.]|jgi:transmembrane sensor|uniref:FecR family protein n=1 Tax=Pedobacter sp. TaxID=1411316 RepID=UPI002C5F75D0|nr:FecR domain-containing protein [Pedobacter sp.]HWW41613.1 FecR domain-containing protein [Pedobacter sp.]